MSIGQLLKKKRDGEKFTMEETSYFIKEMVAGRLADSQIGAMLMAIFIKGLTDAETLDLTKCMIASGSRLQWEGLVVDKHSTGGVGDKISIILAPVLAACGLKVPMISGRSLEFTGGTLDKLESIPGFQVDLSEEMMEKALDDAGLFIAAATDQICPADKMLYRVRDITSTVDYINLIVPSIISKKVASGVKFLVLDVKVGKAAFIKNVESGRALAKQLIRVGQQLGARTRVVLSRMDQPLGHMVGNSLEILESVQCLSGNMPSDIARLLTVLASNLLEMTGYQGDAEELVRKVLVDGSAMDRFRRMLRAQGVSEETQHKLTAVLPTAKYTTQFKSAAAGWVLHVDALTIAKTCQSLGAGRQSSSSEVDHAVGVEVRKHIGDTVEEGETWLTVHHSCAELCPTVQECLQHALVVSTEAVSTPDIVIEVIQ